MALIIAVCLAVPMAVYMAVRGHGRRLNLVMAGTTIGVGLVMAALLWSGVIPTAGLQTWHSLFGLVCGPGLPAHDRRDADQLRHLQRPGAPPTLTA